MLFLRIDSLLAASFVSDTRLAGHKPLPGTADSVRYRTRGEPSCPGPGRVNIPSPRISPPQRQLSPLRNLLRHKPVLISDPLELGVRADHATASQEKVLHGFLAGGGQVEAPRQVGRHRTHGERGDVSHVDRLDRAVRPARREDLPSPGNPTQPPRKTSDVLTRSEDDTRAECDRAVMPKCLDNGPFTACLGEPIDRWSRVAVVAEVRSCITGGVKHG